MVSVIIPSYNREKTIKKAVESVLEQTYMELEVIVVDDCSSDHTQNVVQILQNQDPRVKYIRHEENQGACAARNTGIRAAKGEWIAFHDSDDIWVKNKLEIQINILKEKKADVVCSAINRHNYGKKPEKYPCISEGLKTQRQIAMGFFISTQTILGKREVFERYSFDVKIPRMQDYDLMIRVSEKYQVYYIDQALVDVYLQPDSITNKGHKYKKQEEIARIFLKKYPGLSKVYPEWEVQMLKRIGHAMTMEGENASAIYRDIYQKMPSIQSFLILQLSRVHLLKQVFHFSEEREKKAGK